MNFMEILWKSHGMPIEKAITTLDEIINAVGIEGSRAVGMSKNELKNALKDWGTNKKNKYKQQTKPSSKPQPKMSFKPETQEEIEEVFDEPIHPSKKDEPEWRKRGRKLEEVNPQDFESRVRQPIRVSKPKTKKIGGKKTKVTPVTSMAPPKQARGGKGRQEYGYTNPQTGSVTEQEQEMAPWIYIDEEEFSDTMGKSYQEILKVKSKRQIFMDSIKDLPPQERKEKMAEYISRYKQKGSTFKGKLGKPKIFWSRRHMKKPRKGEGRMTGQKIPTLKVNNPQFMVEALREIKDKQNSQQIDILIQLILNKDKKGSRVIGTESDRYTVTGKPGTKEIRPYNEQELVLDKLLDLLEKGYNYKSRVDLQREVEEQKILSSSFLSSLSQDLFGDTKNIHPRIIDNLKKPNIFHKFRKFLTSQGKNLPRETSFRSALRRLDSKKVTHSRVMDMLLNRSEDYIYREDMYDEHLKTVNAFVKKNINALSKSLKPLVKEGLIGDWDNILEDVKNDYDKLNASKKKRITLDEFEGRKLVNVIKEILEDVNDLESAQRAKMELIEIGQSNGKSGTVNNDSYDIIMENYDLLRQSYHWDKYIQEARIKIGGPKEASTEKPSGKPSIAPKPKYNTQQKQVYKLYKKHKKTLWNSRQNIKQLKKEIRGEDTDMIHQWNEAQREKDPRYVSNLDNLKKRLRKEQAIVDRLVRSLEAIEEKYPDLLGENQE